VIELSARTKAILARMRDEPPAKIDGRGAANQRRARFRRVPLEKGAEIRILIPQQVLDAESGCETFVYFMQVGRRVKIGMSKNVKKRAKDIQTGQSDRVEVRYSVKGGRILEKHFHQKFKSENLHGEWFRLDGPIEHFLNGLPYSESEHNDSWRL
jgi:hypothetical protein